MRWIEKEINEAVNLLKEKLTYQEIGIELNRTSGSVRNKLNELGYRRYDETKEVRNCLCCDKEFKTTIFDERKFCDNSCSATYNNKLRGVKNKTHDKKCVICSKSIKKHSTFCSNTCSGEFKKNEKFIKIENGDKTLSERIYKLYLIHKHGNKCMECGWNKVHQLTGNVPIQLEHIDGNSDNNYLENLKLLCPNCHSLTPTYGALNKHNEGRESKRNVTRRIWRKNKTQIAGVAQ